MTFRELFDMVKDEIGTAGVGLALAVALLCVIAVPLWFLVDGHDREMIGVCEKRGGHWILTGSNGNREVHTCLDDTGRVR